MPANVPLIARIQAPFGPRDSIGELVRLRHDMTLRRSLRLSRGEVLTVLEGGVSRVAGTASHDADEIIVLVDDVPLASIPGTSNNTYAIALPRALRPGEQVRIVERHGELRVASRPIAVSRPGGGIV